MEYSVLVGPIQALLGALCSVLWVALTETRKKAEKVEAELAAYKVEAAEKFSTKHDLQAAIESVTKAIDRQGQMLEVRLTRIEQHILDNQRKQ